LAIAIAGLSPRGWHLAERIGLRDDAVVAAAWDASHELRTEALAQGWPTRDSLAALLHDAAIDGVIVTARLHARADLIACCLDARKHVLAEPPVADSSSARLYDLAEAGGVCLWAASPRRWEDDVRAARRAVESGRLGRLTALRLTSAAWAPWARVAEPAPSDDPHSTCELVAPHVLDQLAELTDEDIVRVWTQPFPSEHGFLAALTLADGAAAMIDLRRRSLTGRQTGWLLEGEAAGYRGGRIYAPTPEGEIVDEAIPLEPSRPDPLIDEWLARCALGAQGSDRARGLRLATMYERLSAALPQSLPA
jgi:predicted dehydrogenase